MTKKEQEFHRQRRMFAITDDCLEIAPAGRTFGHFEWLGEEKFKKAVRGYVDPKGDVHFYVGKDFQVTDKACAVMRNHLGLLCRRLNVASSSNIFGGAIPDVLVKTWEPRRCYGSISQFLNRRTKLTSFTVWICQINQTCMTVKARNMEQARDKAKRRWRKEHGQPEISCITENE